MIMITIFRILIFASLLCYVGCDMSSEKVNLGQNNLGIDHPDELTLSQIGKSSFRYVVINDSLLSLPIDNNIVISSTTIAILDGVTFDCNVYDSEGRKVVKIPSPRESPFKKIDVDPKRRLIFLLSYRPSTLSIYDFNGSLVSSNSIESIPFDFVALHEDGPAAVFYYPPPILNNHNKFRFAKLKKSGIQNYHRINSSVFSTGKVHPFYFLDATESGFIIWDVYDKKLQEYSNDMKPISNIEFIGLENEFEYSDLTMIRDLPKHLKNSSMIINVMKSLNIVFFQMVTNGILSSGAIDLVSEKIQMLPTSQLNCFIDDIDNGLNFTPLGVTYEGHFFSVEDKLDYDSNDISPEQIIGKPTPKNGNYLIFRIIQ